MILKTLIIISLLFTFGNTTECEDYIKSLINSVESGSFTDIPAPVILFSGTSLNNPGQFLECQNFENFTYYLTYQSPDFSMNTNSTSENLLGYFVGLCVPSFCNQKDINNVFLFTRTQVHGYQNGKMNILQWTGVGLFIAYFILILVATIMKSIKTDKKNQPSYLKSQQNFFINLSSANSEALTQPLVFAQKKSEQQSTLMDSFDVYQNYNKIFQINPNRNILFGPNCIAILMIVVAYQYSYRQTVAINYKSAATLLNTSFGFLITNVELAFATLFWIFGMNTAYALYSTKSLNDIFKSILNKLIRAWPVLILYTLFAYGIAGFIISEPLDKLWNILYNKNCTLIFWRKWLLVNTMIPDDTTCLPWTWIFEVQILLYVLSPLFVVLHKAKKWLGYLVLGLLILGSLLYSFIILEIQRVPFYPSLLFNNNHSYVYYFQMHPLSRASQFYFGLLLGIFIKYSLEKLDSQIKPKQHVFYKYVKNSQRTQWIMQIFGLGFIITSIFLITTVKDQHARSIFVRVFIVLIPFAFIIGLSLLVLPSFFNGKGHLTQFMNYILGSNFWSSFYKLSNSIYLTAPVVIGFTTYSLQFAIYYSYQQITLLFLGDLLLIFFISLIFCSCLQIPFHEIQRRAESYVFGKKMHESVVFIQQ